MVARVGSQSISSARRTITKGRVMTTKPQPSFLRLFLGGFAIGAVALVSVTGLDRNDASLIPSAHAQTTTR